MAYLTTRSPAEAQAIVDNHRKVASSSQSTNLQTTATAIKTQTDKIPAEVIKTAAIKVETDKIPAEVIKTAAIQVETNKIPATITKIDDIQSISGLMIKKSALKLSGDGAQTEDLFEFTGPIRIKELYLHITTATNATTLQLLTFNLNDGTNDVALDGNVDASGSSAGSLIGKLGILASDPVIGDADEIRALQNTSHPNPFYGAIAVPKTGEVTNKVQLKFTGDADTDVDVDVYMRYVPLTTGAAVTVATA